MVQDTPQGIAPAIIEGNLFFVHLPMIRKSLEITINTIAEVLKARAAEARTSCEIATALIRALMIAAIEEGLKDNLDDWRCLSCHRCFGLCGSLGIGYTPVTGHAIYLTLKATESPNGTADKNTGACNQ